jgi:hypothetical protein
VGGEQLGQPAGVCALVGVDGSSTLTAEGPRRVLAVIRYLNR